MSTAVIVNFAVIRKQVIEMTRIRNYELLYRKSPKSSRVIIDVSLDVYMDFYHEWDNASFRKRDLHPELADFLDLCSEDIPIRKKFDIVFTIFKREIDAEKEAQIRTSYYNYYNGLRRLENRKTKRYLKTALILLFISFFLLSAHRILGGQSFSGVLSDVFLEGLLIGSWVFTWEAVHLLFLDIIQPFYRRREIKRFLSANVSFNYDRTN